MHYEKSIALDENYIEAHINVASVREQLGQIEEAKAAYRRALEI